MAQVQTAPPFTKATAGDWRNRAQIHLKEVCIGQWEKNEFWRQIEARDSNTVAT